MNPDYTDKKLKKLLAFGDNLLYLWWKTKYMEEYIK